MPEPTEYTIITPCRAHGAVWRKKGSTTSTNSQDRT